MNLTPTEKLIQTLLDNNWRISEIAKTLGITTLDVKIHLHSAREKQIKEKKDSDYVALPEWWGAEASNDALDNLLKIFIPPDLKLFTYQNKMLEEIVNSQKKEVEITWTDAIKDMIDGKIVKLVHSKGQPNESIYHMRRDSRDQFQLFDIDSYVFLGGFLDADDITEGKWYKI